MTSTTRKLGMAAVILVIAVLLSRVLGFLRDAFIAAAFGANGQTDAFIAAFTIPDWLNYLVAGGTLSITFIPIYTRHLAAGHDDEGNRVFSIIATVMGLVVALGVIGLELAAPRLCAWYLDKLRPEDLALAVRLTRILLPAQIFFYLGGLASATLMARQRFVAASMAPLVYNAGTIIGGIVGGRALGVESLAWGTLAGAALGNFALQAVAGGRAGLRYVPSVRVGHVDFRDWLVRSLPLMVGVSLVTADDWIVRYFAAADEGAISCLSYARKLVLVPIAVAGQAVGQASMPFFARLWAEGKRGELSQLVMRSVRASGAIAALAAMGMVALAEPLVDLLFRRGHFGAAQVEPTARYLSLYALAIPLWGMQGLIGRAFYASGDTLTPMLAGTAVTLVSLPLYAVGNRLVGVEGLVIASGLGILMHTASLLLLLPRRMETDRRQMILGPLRAFGLGLLAAAPAYLAARHLPHGHLQGHLLTALRVLVGGLVYLSIALPLARPLGVDDVAAFGERLARRLRPR
jgi:putative peptidoglycan lipid II flippase